MSPRLNPLAGKPAPAAVAGQYSAADHRVLQRAAGSVRSLRNGSPSAPPGIAARSFDVGFNEAHVLAISQAICEYRKQQGIDGPLFMGFDTHALSAPAFASALEVLAANGVESDDRGG